MTNEHYSLKPEYIALVEELEGQGFTTSDAQGHADLHFEGKISDCIWHLTGNELSKLDSFDPTSRTATCVTCDAVFTITMNDSGIFLVNHRCI